jgi:ribonuclease P protein component
MKQSRSVRAEGVVLYYRKRLMKAGTSRLGVVVSKRVCKLAARRNRLKRITREVFRTTQKRYVEAFDLVIRFTSAPEKQTGNEIKKKIETTLLNAKLIN